MRKSKSHKYKNYGMIPQNEYTTANTGKNADTAAVFKDNPQTRDMAYSKRLIKRQDKHPSGRRKIRGWPRSWKINGWQAELAALYDETSDMERDSAYL